MTNAFPAWNLGMARQIYNLFEELHRKKQFTWSDAVKKGRILAISGMVAIDDSGRTLFPGDLVAQTRYIYETVKRLLETAGASFADIIKTTDYIAPQALPDYPKTAAIRREYFGENYPAATGVVVQSLLRPDWLIEIDFLGVLE